MSTDDIPTVLGSSPLLGGVAADVLLALSRDCRVREYRRGQPVFFQGDPSDSLLIVVAGRLKVSVSSVHGDEMLLDVIEPGESVGEVGILDGEPRSATVEAIEQTSVVVVPGVALWSCMERYPAAAHAVMRSLGATLRRLTGDASDLVFLDLPRRLAKLLLAAMPAAGSDKAALGLNQTELGHRIGGTRQSVNSALRAFVRRGWITTDGNDIVIEDRVALERFLGT